MALMMSGVLLVRLIIDCLLIVVLKDALYSSLQTKGFFYIHAPLLLRIT
jgi:hypothetical protein